MINLAVINLKVLFKKMIKLTCIMIAFVIVLKLGILIYNNVKKLDFQTLDIKSHISLLKENLAFTENIEKATSNKKVVEKILSSELTVFYYNNQSKEAVDISNEEVIDDSIEVAKIEDQIEVVPEIDSNEIQSEVQQTENVKTSVISENNKKDVYTDVYKSVQIKNESNYSLTESMITPDISYSNKKDIMIYHTHTCESYTKTENSQYVETGNFRTTDLNYSVARVGTELENCLSEKGYTVIHDTTYHDYPAYTGSYNRSLSTVTNLLNTYPNVECIFDVHRDALRK